MVFFFSLFSFLWLARSFKSIFFWVYLWQLKEYHIGRFLDHFRTYKGQRIFLNLLPSLKVILFIILLAGSQFFAPALYFILLLYVIEVAAFLVSVINGNAKKPVVTIKTSLLVLGLITLTITFLQKAYELNDGLSFATALLLFDILLPAVVAFVVLLFQPLFALAKTTVLHRAAKKIEQFGNLKVVAITGSYGKTSTKEFLATILSSKFKVLATKEHRNSEIGIATTVLEDLNDSHEVFIAEMGAYNTGGITLLCDMVSPEIGVVTGVNGQHLATFGSMENLLSAEGGRELLESLPKEGFLVVNGDNKYCVDLYKSAKIHKQFYAVNNIVIDADIFTKEVTVGEHFLDFIAMTKKGEVAHFNVNVLGRQNIQNLLAAILVAKEIGMSLEEISEAAKNIKQEQAGITLRRGIHGINIIDSSYSSNPDGVNADLEYLKVFHGKRAIVMPCLIELGEKSVEVHKEIGKKIAEICDMAIITTKDKLEEIKQGAIQGGMHEDRIIFCEKPEEILSHITTFCGEGDAVLLEGRVSAKLVTLLK